MKLLNPATNSNPVGEEGVVTVQTVAPTFARHGVAFAGMYLFTLLLYLRPNELFPEVFGNLQIIKFVAVTGLVAYVIGKMSNAEPMTIWTIEVKMVMVMVVLSLVLMVGAISPDESWFQFSDTYSKVVIIFLMMTNLLDTRERLIKVFNLVIAGGIWVAYYAIQTYNAGEYMLIAKGITRIAGVGGGMFGNPNDLANALDMLIPMAFVLGLSRKGIVRYVYFGCVALFCYAVQITYSRGAFLGLIAMAVFMAWKLGRGRRFKMIVFSTVAVGLILAASPGGFGKRMATIFDVEKDQTGSSYQRRELLKRALVVVAAHPIGVGMANYHYYSLNEERAHNAFLEASAELGLLGLLAYLIINFAPLIKLWRFERKMGEPKSEREKEIYNICVGLQATFIAYYVCSFFASIQYYWFLYYPVAHTIAFLRINQLSQAVSSEETALVPSGMQQPAGGQTKGGVLWQPNYAQIGILWAKRNQPRQKETVAKGRLWEKAG